MKNDLNNKNNDVKERVLYIWSVPANGHLNPTLCFTNQLILRLDEMKIDKIIFYCGTSFKDIILSLPNNLGQNKIEFRDYRLEKYSGSENLLKLLMNFDTRPGKLFRVFKCFKNSVKIGCKHIFKYLLEDIYRDKPAVILYDQALFFPKLAFSLYAKKYNCPKPLHACYVTTFLCAKGVYPHWTELDKMGLLGNNSKIHYKLRNFFITIMDFLMYVITYYKTLLWDYRFSLIELITKCDLPISRNHIIDDSLNIVFVLPEIQPRLKEFQSQNIKFVGPCVDETVRARVLREKFDMDKYVTMIENFLLKNKIEDATTADTKSIYDNISNVDDHLNDEKTSTKLIKNVKSNDLNINPCYDSMSDTAINNPAQHLMRCESTGENFKKSHKPIIYVSMGTVFNNENSSLFETIVRGCKFFSNDYSIIVSTGDEKAYEKYAKSSLNSGKILFVPHTPQVEILKRAHLFITHAGMNSVSEALQFGVPIICLPLSGDQPFVAWRVADELGIGIRLQPDNTLTVEKVKSAISEILNNSVYRERANDLAVISKRYCGYKTAVEHVVNFVNRDPSEKFASTTPLILTK